MSCRLFAVSLMVAVAALVSSARATIIQPTEATSDDVFVYEFLPTFNFQTFGPPFNTLLSAGKTGIGHDTETLIRFDQSLIPTPLGFHTAANLSLFVGSATSAGFGANPDAANPVVIDLYLVTSPWSESTVTWGTKPTTNALPSASISIDGINKWVSFNVSDLIPGWVNSPATNYGVLLRQNAVVAGGRVAVFNSALGANLPLLDVSPVPEPTSLTLVTGATLALACGVRRRTTRRRNIPN